MKAIGQFLIETLHEYGLWAFVLFLLAWVLREAVPALCRAIVEDRDNKRYHKRQLMAFHERPEEQESDTKNQQTTGPDEDG